MLLHEVGHILGIGHIPHTVMRTDIVEYLHGRASVDWYEPFGIDPSIDAIDHQRQLLLGAILYEPALTSVKGLDVFKILTGKLPQNTLPTVSLDLTVTGKATLIFHEKDQADVSVPLTRYYDYYEEGITFVGQATVFKKLLGTSTAPQISTDVNGSLIVLYHARTPSGENVIVQVERNTNNQFAGIVALIHEGRYLKLYLKLGEWSHKHEASDQ